MEAAAIFLIFTSMFWNLAFSVYETLITLPEELVLAGKQFGLRGPLVWTRLILPAVAPNLLYNSILSWSNGWYFLMASEIIAAGPARYTLPGLGSYLAQAIESGPQRPDGARAARPRASWWWGCTCSSGARSRPGPSGSTWARRATTRACRAWAASSPAAGSCTGWPAA